MLGWNLNRCHKQLNTGLGVATRFMLTRGGQNGIQYMPGTRPWRTYSRGATRRPLFKYVHWLLCIVVLYLYVLMFMIRLCSHLAFSYLSFPFLRVQNLIHNSNLCLFSQVKNKPWCIWVYTWFWHCREHYSPEKHWPTRWKTMRFKRTIFLILDE